MSAHSSPDAGIAPDRLAFDAGVPLRDYLVRYQDIDLCLDPFPYTGGVTTHGRALDGGARHHPGRTNGAWAEAA